MLAAFREALLALVPVVEREHIPWRDGEAYDEWDAVADGVYQGFVIVPLQDDAPLGAYPLPRYAHQHSSYQMLSRIHIRSREFNEMMFFGFATVNATFDSVRCIPIDSNNDPAGGPDVIVAFDGVQFVIRWSFADGREPVEMVELE